MGYSGNRFSGGGYGGGGGFGSSGGGYGAGKDSLGVSDPMEVLKKAGIAKGTDLTSSDFIKKGGGTGSSNIARDIYGSKSNVAARQDKGSTDKKDTAGEKSSLDGAIKAAASTEADFSKGRSVGFSGEKKINDKDNVFIDRKRESDPDRVSEYDEYMDIAGNKFFYAVAYTGIFCFVPLLRRESIHGKFHAAQGLLLLLAALFGNGVFWLLNKFVFSTINISGMQIGSAAFVIISGMYNLAVVALCVIGIIRVLMGQTKKLPIIGKISKIDE